MADTEKEKETMAHTEDDRSQPEVRYIVLDHVEQAKCDNCGAPILASQEAYQVENEGLHVYCSRYCVPRS